MKVLLSNSYYLNRHPEMQREPHLYPPLGPLYVAAYIRHKGPWDVQMFDCTFARDESEYAAAVYKHRPSIVGIQSTITTRPAARNMIKIAKQAEAIVVVGGPDPTVSYSDYLHWGADFVVIGEGEVTALELMFHLANNEPSAARTIRGIAYHNESNVVVNPPRPLIANLDQLPLPALDLIAVEPYLELWQQHHDYTELHMMTSRGCPFTCTWCSRAVFGRSFRQRSVVNVVDEMVYLRDSYGVDRLWIADDTFGLNQRWLEAWCREVVRSGLQIPFKCMTRVDLIRSEMLQRLKEVGCYQIHLGVESGSQRVLDAMQKRTRVDQIREASKMIRDAGIELGFFIMFGYPGEKTEDIRKTEQLIFEMNPDTLGVSIAYPVPGTEFYDIVKDRLVADAEDRWEKTGADYQLMFKSEYPEMYYRHLIQYVLKRLALRRPRRFVRNKMVDLLKMWRSRLIVRVFELVMKISVALRQHFRSSQSVRTYEDNQETHHV